MKIKSGFELQNVCNEYLVISAGIENVDFSKIISLNPTAAYLWGKVAGMESFTADTLTELLLQEYDVEESIAREDSQMIIERWLETGLLEE